jgi:hypothetical protein
VVTRRDVRLDDVGGARPVRDNAAVGMAPGQDAADVAVATRVRRPVA